MNFTCPHCGMPQIVSQGAFAEDTAFINIGRCSEFAEWPEAKNIAVGAFGIRCANEECNRASISVTLSGGGRDVSGYQWKVEGSDFHSFRAYPLAGGKPFPGCIPQAMLEDYNEAWSIINLSPKSAATLARRCLQAMIRDFCQIRERTLFHEIQKLEDRLQADDLPKGVEEETVEAMKALKDVGNIGAHLTEADGIIVDVEPGEAEALLGLIEMLFNDWYVARDKRQKRLAEIREIAATKRGETV